MLWLLFALFAAAAWGASNLVDEHLAQTVPKSASILVAISGFFAIVPAGVLFLLGDITWPGWPMFLLAAAAGIMELLLLYPYFRAVTTTDAAFVSPLWHFSTIFTVILAWIFLNETLDWKSYMAVALLIASATLASVRKIRGAYPYKALGWMILAAGIYAFQLTIEKILYERVPVTTGYGWILITAFVMSICLTLFNRGTRDGLRVYIQRRLIPLNVGNQTISHLGYLCASIALSLGSISMVKATTGLIPLFILLYSFFLEKICRKRLVSSQSRMTYLRILLSVPLAILGLLLIPATV